MPPKLSNDRALRIVVAARDEFARRGLAGARVEQIARRAGVNKQLLFYYYHSKLGLFQALLAEGQGLGQVRDYVDPHLAAAQALILMIGYLSMEAVVAASARPLGGDEPALRERWREAAVDLVVAGVSAR